MDITQLLIQLAGGALGGVGGNAAIKNNSLGPLGNTITGAIGGGLGGQLLGPLFGLGATAATGSLDIGAIIQGFATGGVSGGVLAIVVALVKAKLFGR